jgi:Flp pilus assembly protein TadG
MSGLLAQTRRFADDRRGVTAITTALLLVVALGFVGFGIDFGMGYTSRRTAQSAADSAAFTGAVAQFAGAGDAVAQAQAVAATYGVKDGAGGVTVSVNTPPQTGGHTADPNAVEVIISRPGTQFFAGLLGQAKGVIRARAVATVQPGKNADGCVVTFDPTGLQTLLMNGNPDVDLDGCSVYDNSSSAQAFAMNGSASLTAVSANVVGGFFHNGNTELNAALNTGVKPLTDPYADTDVPAYSPAGCDSSAVVNGNTSKTFAPVNGQPYVFCSGSGLIINGGADVTFAPGTYVFDAGSFIINGNATVRGDGVTFVLTSHTGSSVATVTINGGADVKVSAPLPSSGQPLPGMVFYQDRRASTTGRDIFNGGARQVFTGALYFPHQPMVFNGGTSVADGGCTQILAYQLTFNGNARVSNHCDGVGTRQIGGFTTVLVE